jgi:hypothetical protein
MLERRTGSQGGSGGEKEIIASYVLTASLSYALCPDGASRPVFGTIVLDEAFSKSSQAVAARIIQALREFGLHALFVTPNKEVRLLRNHTRSAVVVHRRGAQATLASLRWEEIDAFRRSAPSTPQHPKRLYRHRGMKSPQDLAARLAQHWNSADWRERQLLGTATAWPLTLPIGQPDTAVFSERRRRAAQPFAAMARRRTAGPWAVCSGTSGVTGAAAMPSPCPRTGNWPNPRSAWRPSITSRCRGMRR